MGLEVESYQSPVDNLFVVSQIPVESDVMTILTGQGVLKRGTVLGKVTASGKGKLVDNSLTDGAEKVFAILSTDVDTTNGDVEGVIYLSGAYNINSLTFGGDDTAADHKDFARTLSIYFKQAVSA